MFDLDHPIVSAPMGGGGGARDWLERECALARAGTDRPWGIGLLSWAIDASPLDWVIEQQPATSTLLAASPLVQGIGGRYFENCNEAGGVDRRGGPGKGGVAPYALDPANAQRLWDLSLDLIG